MKIGNIIDFLSDVVSLIGLLPIKQSLRDGHDYRKIILSSVELGMFPTGQPIKVRGYLRSSYDKANHDKFECRSLLNEWVEKNITIESFGQSAPGRQIIYSDSDINKYNKHPHKIKLIAFYETSPYILLFIECRVKSRFGKRFLFSTFRINDIDKLSIIRDRNREKSLKELLP